MKWGTPSYGMCFLRRDGEEIGYAIKVIQWHGWIWTQDRLRKHLGIFSTLEQAQAAVENCKEIYQ